MANFGTYLEHQYEPPFEDWWAIKAIDHDLKTLSAELLSLPPGVLEASPLLATMSRTIEEAIIRRRSNWRSIP